ncbi:MAG: ABC transporter permease, partial [Acidobacteriia bacterium]|nr:ABC transporter permease [Terriglobia bacterium]
MRDLRYALRLIRQNWGFSLTVIAILALCIGANTAVLSVVNAAMFRPLDYPEPERLGAVASRAFGREGEFTSDSHDGRTWELIKERVPSLDGAVYGGGFGGGVNMGVNGAGVYVKQQRVSAGFFHAIGIAPEIGREFNDLEDRAGGPAAVILSHNLWKKYFHGDPGVVGRGILLRGEPYTVIGVIPAGFRFADVAADVWTPVRPSRTGEGGGSNYGVIGRIKPGATWVQASSELNALVPELKRQRTYSKDAKVQLELIGLQQDLTSELRQPLKMLWAAVAAVFILGCVNIGGMLLARASGRVGEIATRLALGAPIGRIVRQLLVESTTLGLIGGAAGIGVGYACLQGLKILGADAYSLLETVDLDWRVLLATLALTVIAGIGFGLVPAWQAAHVDLRSAQTGTRTVAGKKRFVPLGALVGGQVALAVPLLIGAGLLLRTFLYLWNINPGFDPNHVLTAQFSMQDARYKTAAAMSRMYDEVIDRLRQQPGIEAVAASLTLPYERALNDNVQIPGYDRPQITNLTYVTPEFFTALRIPLQQGRLFTRGDGASSDKVAIVNQAFANLYLKNGALGQPLGGSEKSRRTIVGVVGNVQEKRAGWGDFGPVAAVPTMYMPAAQAGDEFMFVHVWFSPNWIVRSSLPQREVAATVERVTRSVDPLLPVAEFRSINDIKSATLAEQRFLAALVDALGGLAILLTTLGIYGLIANLVAERTKELGIRMALGASTKEAVWTAVRPGLLWVV